MSASYVYTLYFFRYLLFVLFIFRDCTLHDALQVLEDNEDLNPLQIFIEPPDPAIQTDEDSAEED